MIENYLEGPGHGSPDADRTDLVTLIWLRICLVNTEISSTESSARSDRVRTLMLALSFKLQDRFEQRWYRGYDI